MNGTRRSFLKLSAAAGAAGLATTPLGRMAAAAAAPRPLDILILGGTGFIGPHQVRYALSRGHKVTLFNRGRTDPGLFPEIETLVGDRDGNLEALKGRKWDAVLDNSGYYPRHVRDSAQLLKDSAGRYLFVSTISVYNYDEEGRKFELGDTEDTAPIMTMEDPTFEPERPGRYYGPMKALCEDETRKAFGDRATIVRPGLIIGPGDRTGRFRHWFPRILGGNEILVPGKPDDAVQLIDARDLTGWMVRLLEADVGGTMNGVGPEAPHSSASALEEIRSVTGKEARFTWVSGDFLSAREVAPTAYLPWLFGEWIRVNQMDNSRALASGISYLPLNQTAGDVYHLLDTPLRDEPRNVKWGLEPEKETEILADWHAR